MDDEKLNDDLTVSLRTLNRIAKVWTFSPQGRREGEIQKWCSFLTWASPLSPIGGVPNSHATLLSI